MIILKGGSPPLNRPPTGDEFRKLHALTMLGYVYATEIPSMTVKINPVSFWINGTRYVEYGGGLSPALVTPNAGAKWVLVCLAYDENLRRCMPVTVNGLPASNNDPPFPEINKDYLPLAAIYLDTTSYRITQSMIYDVRAMYSTGSPSVSHENLSGRDLPDAHPIDSITGLQDALDNKTDVAEVENIISGKADLTGTSSQTFTLNNAQTGMPTNDIYLYIERGSLDNVGFRWNESNDVWELTNDGLHWYEFSGNVAEQTATITRNGAVKLSVDPPDPENPVAVGDNDPRILTIDEKDTLIDLPDIVNNINSRIEAIELEMDGGEF
jgi:hypothetical protein